MILYFTKRLADKQGRLKIGYMTSTSVPNQKGIISDTTSESVETGVKTLECEILSNEVARKCVIPGNFVLCHSDEIEDALYTITETEHSASDRTIRFYAEDVGLDLLNSIAGPWTATTSINIVSAVKAVLGSNYLGWKVDYNGVDKSKKLSKSKFEYTSDDTLTSRLLSVLGLFNAEMYFTYSIDGFKWINRTIKVVNKRGKNNRVTVRLGKDVTNITEKADINSLATAYKLYGVNSSGKKLALSKLSGYSKYSGDTITPSTSAFSGTRTHTYKVVGNEVRCVDGMKNWKSALDSDGKILVVKTTNYKTAADAISYALRELEKVVDTAYSYEVEFMKKPSGVKIGDVIRIVDETDELYLQARILSYEYSEVDASYTATIGNYKRLTSSKAEVVSLENLNIRSISISSNLTNGVVTLTATLFVNGDIISSIDELEEGQYIQWYKDGVEISGANGFTLETTLSSAKYSCKLLAEGSEE